VATFETRLVGHEHAAIGAKAFGGVGAQVVADRIGVPAGVAR
jgi:hypothetical protein